MTPDPFCSQIADYILSGHAYLHLPTTEKTRVLAELKTLAESLPDGGRQVYTWSHATGWRNADGNSPTTSSDVQPGQLDPQRVPQEILDLPENSIFVLQNFGFYLAQKTYSYFDVVIAWLVEIRDMLASSGRTVIFLGPDFDVPAALVNDVTTVDFPLPDDAAIEASVRFVADGQKLGKAALPGIVSAFRGITQQQVEDRTALALRKFKSLNGDAARLILHEKAEVPEAVPLYGYQGDVRPQQVHIVIRRQHVGSGANDVGWERQPDGTYRAWISEYDAGGGEYKHCQDTARFNQAMQNQIRQEYAYQVIERQQRARGRSVSRQRLPNGEFEVTIAGYR